jgi:hypothetical protein
MKFRDLFVPKLAHSDPEVRKKAIESETDKGVLQRVIDNDSDPDVKQKAAERLEELSEATA